MAWSREVWVCACSRAVSSHLSIAFPWLCVCVCVCVCSCAASSHFVCVCMGVSVCSCAAGSHVWPCVCVCLHVHVHVPIWRGSICREFVWMGGGGRMGDRMKNFSEDAYRVWDINHTWTALCHSCYNYRGGWREYCGLVDSHRGRYSRLHLVLEHHAVKTRRPGGSQPPLPPGCLAYTRTQWEPTAAPVRLACRINISEADIHEVCCEIS